MFIPIFISDMVDSLGVMRGGVGLCPTCVELPVNRILAGLVFASSLLPAIVPTGRKQEPIRTQLRALPRLEKLRAALRVCMKLKTVWLLHRFKMQPATG